MRRINRHFRRPIVLALLLRFVWFILVVAAASTGNGVAAATVVGRK